MSRFARYFTWIWACFLAVTVAWSVPSEEQVRAATLEYVLEGRQQEGIEKMSTYLSRRLKKTLRVASRELGTLGATAECVRFMELSIQAQPTAETTAWILGSGKRLHALLDIWTPQNRPKACLEVLDRLRNHDPVDCDTYFDLMLAISVVMDRPGHPKMHRQMGKDLLPVETDPLKVYDYFKTLYSGGKSEINYQLMEASELVFVVVPAPLRELEWARDNVTGSLSDWDKKYGEIEYDTARLRGSRFSWDHGTYTLRAIERLGGICVDQAYYAVLSARAHGIPALYFRGSGRSANHAWFAFMKDPGDWVLDVGRYQGEEFTTGHAIHPQTRDHMTDHDMEYTCERSLHSKNAVEASSYISIAEVLLERDPASALQCARRAREISKRGIRSWEMEQELLAEQKDYDGLIKLFSNKKDAFRKYPDVLVKSAKQIETILRDAGRATDADKLVRSASGAVDDDRDDITRSLEDQRIRSIMASGDMKKARREMEQMLDDQKDQGNKVFDLIREYIELTKKSGQTREAVKFLEDYIEDLIKMFDFPPRYEEGLLGFLLNALENAGETKDAAKLRKRIERLRFQQNT
jgi:hypothetical protein